MIGAIPVFYTPKMLADSLSFSPSAMKPKKVVNAWQQLGIPLDICEPDPVSVAELSLAHEQCFVEQVLSGEVNNGFSNTDKKIAFTLPYTNGSMRTAAFAAIENGVVAVSPTSGFHHAHWNMASGFCTFNGLIVAAQCLLKKGKAKRVGIVDCDYHYGNGTDNIIDKLNLQKEIKHFTAGKVFHYPRQRQDFFEWLQEVMVFVSDCDVVLYQAGADPHVDDPLGGFLTTEEMYQRDLLVFTACKQYGIPVTWNLAGGYQLMDDKETTNWEALTEIHSNTMKACWEVFG